MKQFISVKDVTNINALVKQALAYKASPFLDKTLGANKRIGLLFLNPSLRTRLSTQVAAQNLGMEPIVYNVCLLYTSPSPRDRTRSRMPSSA